MALSRDEFVELVQNADADNNMELSLKDYVEACQELADYFHSCGEAAEFDLENTG